MLTSRTDRATKQKKRGGPWLARWAGELTLIALHVTDRYVCNVIYSEASISQFSTIDLNRIVVSLWRGNVPDK